jgi:hypothetical protein
VARGDRVGGEDGSPAGGTRTLPNHPWLPAAAANVLLHVLVDFDLQIPAIPVLLVSLIAMRQEAPSS